MIELDVQEIPDSLKQKLQRLLQGEDERIVLCEDGEAVAEIRAVPAAERQPRPFGLARGTFSVTSSFFEPLPSDLLDAFNGE